MNHSLLLQFFCSLLFFLIILPCPTLATPPYPMSSTIAGVTWIHSSHRTDAPGSDNWPMTWADDGHIYSSWGDGGGFGGTNSDGRVSLGVARLEGMPTNYRGQNVWGGKNAENPAQFPGKSYGILSIDKMLYMWVNIQEKKIKQYQQSQLTYSFDKGATFIQGFHFAEADAAFSVCTFLNFGQNYQNARDNYVYIYSGQPLNGCTNRCIGKDVFLARVPKESIRHKESYEFFAGFRSNKTLWNSDITQRAPVFSDPNGAGTRLGVSFHPGPNRYLLTIAHNNNGGLGIFDAPEPWGPWTTVAYYENWLNFGYSPSYHLAPQKWMGGEKGNFIMVWSSNDMFNIIQGSFQLSGGN